jgi:uncharacterized protein (DUF1800 family)
MQTAETLNEPTELGSPATPEPALPHRAVAAPIVALTTLAITACGGGGDPAPSSPLASSTSAPTASTATGQGTSTTTPAATTQPAAGSATLSRAQAARILAQGAFGGRDSDLQNVISLGLTGWLNQQFAMAPSQSNVAWLQANGLNVDGPDQAGVQSSFWRKLISSPDVLRQRLMLALTDVFAVATLPIDLSYRGMAAAYFLDQLEANAFGNYRDLLLAVSRTPAMGAYLTFLNSVRANPVTGAMPDENYARELMQLFSIGIVKLNVDATPVMDSNGDGIAVATFGQNDVLNMARVFTGWQLDGSSGYAGGAAVIRPMTNQPSGCDTGAKTVLGTTIDADLDGEQNLEQAVAILMAHPNMPPFVSRQLIQRLVASNPSADYVARVAGVFATTKGDMQSVITAILSDSEATSAVNLGNPQAGKLREPVARFVQWARTFGLTPAANQWADIGDRSDQGTALGESPLQSPNVFFFFQPGYIPPNTALAAGHITAPEFAITNECSVAGYMNFMQFVIAGGIPGANGAAGVTANYEALLPLVDASGNSAALLAELNILLAAGQISESTLSALQSALDSIDADTTAGQTNRLHAALTLVMSAPEYLIQK